MFRYIIAMIFFSVMGSSANAAEEDKVPLIQQKDWNENNFTEFSMNGDLPNIINYIDQKNFPSEIINEHFLNLLRNRGLHALADALSSEWSWRMTLKSSLLIKIDQINAIKRLLFRAEWGNLEKLFYGLKAARKRGFDGTKIRNSDGRTLVQVAHRYPDIITFLEGYQHFHEQGYDLDRFPSLALISQSKTENVSKSKLGDTKKAFRDFLIKLQENILEQNYNLIISSTNPENINDDTVSPEVLQKIIAHHTKDKKLLAYYLQDRINEWRHIWDLINKNMLLTEFSDAEAQEAGLLPEVKLTPTLEENEELFQAIWTFNFEQIDGLIRKGCRLEESINAEGLSPAEFASSKLNKIYAIALEKNLFWKLFYKPELYEFIRVQMIKDALGF